MKLNQLPLYLNIFLLILGLSFSLSSSWKPYIWEGFGDPYDYLRQAKTPVFSSEFYFPARYDLEKGGVHSPRPFTIPLIYKIAGSNPDSIIIIQKTFLLLSAFSLVLVLSILLSSLSSRLVLTTAIHALVNWWHISGWSLLLLSESLASSFFMLWLASFLWYLHKKWNYILVLHLIILLLFSFTRDNWPYLLLPFYSLFIIFSIWKNRQLLKISISGFVLMLIIFFSQQAAADYGHRYRLPIMHNLLVRVMPNGKWWEWFGKEGMPQQAELKDAYWGIQSDDKKMFNLYNDKKFQPFFDWVDTKGKSAYMKFMILNPGYSLLSFEKKENLQKITASKLYYYGQSPAYAKVFDYIFPLFHWLWIIIMLPVLIYAFFKNFDAYFTSLLILLLVFLLHTLILYNADTYEVERHMFINQLVWHLLCFMTLLAVWDKRNSIFIKKT